MRRYRINMAKYLVGAATAPVSAKARRHGTAHCVHLPNSGWAAWALCSWTGAGFMRGRVHLLINFQFTGTRAAGRWRDAVVRRLLTNPAVPYPDLEASAQPYANGR
jgi:hypothetical protein